MICKRGLIVLSLLLLLVINGCISFSTLQGPETLDPGQLSIGTGVVGYLEEGDSGVFPEVGARVGLTNRMDIGFKIIPPITFLIDAKIELIQRPVTVSADLGWSIFNSADYRVTAFYPMIIMGNDSWYIGAKQIYMDIDGSMSFLGSRTFESSKWLSPTLVVGIVMGDNFRYIPEVNIYFTDDGPYMMPALGLEIEL